MLTNRRSRHVAPRAALALSGVLAIGCSGDGALGPNDVSLTELTASVVDGPAQQATVADTLQGVAVSITTADGRPVAGLTVEWIADRGSVTPSVSQTDRDGVAGSGSWALSTQAGPHTLTFFASVGQETRELGSVTTEALPGPVSAVTVDSASVHPGSFVGSETDLRSIVSVTDGHGNPIAFTLEGPEAFGVSGTTVRPIESLFDTLSVLVGGQMVARVGFGSFFDPRGKNLVLSWRCRMIERDPPADSLIGLKTRLADSWDVPPEGREAHRWLASSTLVYDQTLFLADGSTEESSRTDTNAQFIMIAPRTVGAPDTLRFSPNNEHLYRTSDSTWFNPDATLCAPSDTLDSGMTVVVGSP